MIETRFRQKWRNLYFLTMYLLDYKSDVINDGPYYNMKYEKGAYGSFATEYKDTKGT